MVVNGEFKNVDASRGRIGGLDSRSFLKTMVTGSCGVLESTSLKCSDLMRD